MARMAVIMPKRAYRRLAAKKDTRKAAPVVTPLNRPRKPARLFTSGKAAVAPLENGRAIE